MAGRPPLDDTSTDARGVQRALYASMTPAEKLARMSELTLAVSQLARAGLATRHPDESRPALLLRLADCGSETSWWIACMARGMAPDSLPEPIAVATLVARSLTRIGVLHVIGRSFASCVHGEPRSTNDIDMVVDLRPDDIDAFVAAMGSDFYIARNAVVEAIGTGGAFNATHMPAAVKVDMFVAGLDTFDRERLQRRIPISFSSGTDAVTLFVDTPEDTIPRKLDWYRRWTPFGAEGVEIVDYH